MSLMPKHGSSVGYLTMLHLLKCHFNTELGERIIKFCEMEWCGEGVGETRDSSHDSCLTGRGSDTGHTH
jgi:hypothetical protein